MPLRKIDFQQFIERMESRLAEPLPGQNAQKLMMPAESVEERFDLDRDDARLGGVLILFYENQGQIMIPLTQRHDYKGTHGGQVSLPGGKWEEADSDLQSTALRETFEEIGIAQSQVSIIGKLSDLYIPASNFKVSPFVGYVKENPSFAIDAYEVKELIEAELSALVDKDYHKEKDITVQQRFRLKAPYFDVQGKVVWGATAMMLAELITIVEEISN